MFPPKEEAFFYLYKTSTAYFFAIIQKQITPEFFNDFKKIKQESSGKR